MKILVLSLLMLTSCASTPAQRYGTTMVGYTTSTNMMSTLAESGDLTLEKAEKFETFRAPAWELLGIVKEDLLDGDGNDLTAINALDMLIPLLERMEND